MHFLFHPNLNPIVQAYKLDRGLTSQTTMVVNIKESCQDINQSDYNETGEVYGGEGGVFVIDLRN